MILQHIEDIELQVDKYLEMENGKYMKIRGKFSNELETGQYAFVGSTNNTIKKIDNDNYMFIRKDGVVTHINKTNCDEDLNKIYQEINKKLDYGIKYADDRVKLVEKLLSQNEWIYDLISTNKLMEKEIKKKDSFLAEEQRYDTIIDSLSSYITHAKFKNKEDEEKHVQLQLEKMELEKKDKRKKTSQEFEKLGLLIDEIQNYHHKIIKKKFQSDNNTEFVGDLTHRESKGDFTYQEELKDRNKKAKFDHKKDDIPDEYWDRNYPMKRKETIPFYDKDLHDEGLNKSFRHHDYRPMILKQMKEEVEKLFHYLGLNIKDKKQRAEHIRNIKKSLEFNMWKNISGISEENAVIVNPENVVPKNYDEIIYISGERQYSTLRKMYTDLKSDYEMAKKLLTDEFHFQPAKHSTVYNISSDTWYENEQGDIVEISKNTVLMSNSNTYKGLILNYKDLKDKYEDNQTSDWWALIKDFEDVLNKTEFTNEEQFVLDILFDGYSQKQIENKFKDLDLGGFSQPKISRLINQQIPNKLLNTYLDNVQDWLVINHQLGKYKVCSKCEEPKLANDRYFGKDMRNKDGLQSFCKKCDSYRKK